MSATKYAIARGQFTTLLQHTLDVIKSVDHTLSSPQIEKIKSGLIPILMDLTKKTHPMGTTYTKFVHEQAIALKRNPEFTCDGAARNAEISRLWTEHKSVTSANTKTTKSGKVIKTNPWTLYLKYHKSVTSVPKGQWARFQTKLQGCWGSKSPQDKELWRDPSYIPSGPDATLD